MYRICQLYGKGETSSALRLSLVAKTNFTVHLILLKKLSRLSSSSRKTSYAYHTFCAIDSSNVIEFVTILKIKRNTRLSKTQVGVETLGSTLSWFQIPVSVGHDAIPTYYRLCASFHDQLESLRIPRMCRFHENAKRKYGHEHVFAVDMYKHYFTVFIRGLRTLYFLMGSSNQE